MTGRRRKPPVPEPPEWWQALPALLEGGLDAETVARALSELLPEAHVEAFLGGTTAAAGATKGKTTRTAAVVSDEARAELRVTVPAAGVLRAEGVLNLAARILERRLALDEARAWRGRADEVLALGEAAGGLIHAVNNHLNSVLMSATLIQLKGEGEVRERAGTIREESLRAAEIMKAAQVVRPWQGEEGQRANLAAAVRAVLAADAALSGRVEARLAEGALAPASRVGLERLAGLLMRIALGRAAGGRIAVEVAPGVIAATAPALNGEPGPDDGAGEVRRQAASWLARQFGARLTTEQAEGGMVWRVTWDQAEGGAATA